MEFNRHVFPRFYPKIDVDFMDENGGFIQFLGWNVFNLQQCGINIGMEILETLS